MSPQPTISWTASGGSISAAGLYAAPANAGTYTLTAQVASSTVTGGASVTVAAAGTCASMPAVGNWDAASVSPVTPPGGEPPYEFAGKPMAIAVDPFVSSTVWLATGAGFYKSTNCGASGSWVKVDTGSNASTMDSANGIWSIAVDSDPTRQGTIYAVLSYGPSNGLWKSVNGGVDWTKIQIVSDAALEADFWSNMSMDASNTLHIAMATHGTTSVSGYGNGAIAESFDGGATWPNVVNMPAAWGEQGGLYLVPGTISGTTSTWLWGTGWNVTGSYVTTNSGAAWPAQDQISDSVMGENNILPLQKASNGWYYVPAAGKLIKSQDGVNWLEAWGEINYQSPSVEAYAVTNTTIFTGINQGMDSAALSADSNWTAMQNHPR